MLGDLDSWKAGTPGAGLRPQREDETNSSQSGRHSQCPHAVHLTFITAGVAADVFMKSIKWNIFHGPCATFQQSMLKHKISPGVCERLGISGGSGISNGMTCSGGLAVSVAFRWLLVEARRPPGVQTNEEIKSGQALHG